MLIAVLSSAFAADLDVRVTSSSGVAASLTFHDVEQHPPPPFDVVLNESKMRLTLGATKDSDAWVVESRLERIENKGRTEIFSAPRVTVKPNERAHVKQGGHVPVPNTDPMQFVDSFWAVDLMVRETEAVAAPEPPALP